MDSFKSGIRICVINVWFGGLPSYFNYFHRTCLTNKNIDWILVSDQEFNLLSSENVSRIQMSKQAFANLASEKLGFEVRIRDPYKVCDFKPLFGKIFEEQIREYQYWGYCDLDMIFGNLQKHISPVLVEKPDIISFYANFLSGPFCLYRNTNRINELYGECPGFQSILMDPEHKAFDENIPRKVTLSRRIFYQFLYLLSLIFIGPRYNLHIREIQYQFQWFVKKRISRFFPSSDMTELVFKAGYKKQIKVIFKDFIRSDRSLRRRGHRNWKLIWQDGQLTDNGNGEELFAFHFIESKSDPDFQVQSGGNNIKKFIISENGLEHHDL